MAPSWTFSSRFKSFLSWGAAELKVVIQVGFHESRGGELSPFSWCSYFGCSPGYPWISRFEHMLPALFELLVHQQPQVLVRVALNPFLYNQKTLHHKLKSYPYLELLRDSETIKIILFRECCDFSIMYWNSWKNTNSGWTRQ